jgi:tRNA (Thr-GGU) A37 N-methylase
MRWHKRIRFERDGVSVAADVNAALAVNQQKSGATDQVESVSHVRVVQDSHSAARDARAAQAPDDERKESK